MRIARVQSMVTQMHYRQQYGMTNAPPNRIGNGRLSNFALSGAAMRFLLILLAMLSGLSLTDVAVAASPAHSVGQTELAAAQVAPVAIACPVRARIARAQLRIDTTRQVSPTEAGFVRPCGVTTADRPLE